MRHLQTSVNGVTASIVLALALSGCGGGSASSNMGSNSGSSSVANTMVQVNVGDSPADWMLAFNMNITAMSLTGSNGSVPVVTSAVPVEMLHLMGTMQPLAMVNVPQGTYTGASVTVGSAMVMYMIRPPNLRCKRPSPVRSAVP